MIPARTSDLAPLLNRIGEQTEVVVDMLSEGSDNHALWRPDPSKWSLAGHAAHLAIVNGPYVASIGSVLERAAAEGGPRSDGPWKHPRIATWFVGQMSPPPKRRFKTAKAMTPDPGTSGEEAIQRFQAVQASLREQVEAAHGLDLGRIRFGSPFLSILRLSVGTAFAVLLEHNDRHVWLMREVNRLRSQG